MSFVTKEWKDRIVEFAGRRKLTNVSTSAVEIVDVERNEGTISQAGDAFSAANMNNLEERISNEFTSINENLKQLPKVKIKDFYITGQIPANTYIDKTFDISDLGFTQPPKLVGINMPWCVAHEQPIDGSATTKDSITLRIYALHGSGSIDLDYVRLVLQGITD